MCNCQQDEVSADDIQAVSLAIQQEFDLSEEEVRPEIVLASQDPGEWAPEAALVVYTENSIPTAAWEPEAWDAWERINDRLAEQGVRLYFEIINGAVTVFYPLRCETPELLGQDKAPGVAGAIASTSPVKGSARSRAVPAEGRAAPRSEAKWKPADFNRLAGAYPKADGRKAAIRAWDALTPNADFIELLIASAARFAAHHKREATAKQYICLLPVWLNGERWNDEICQPSAQANAPAFASSSPPVERLVFQADKYPKPEFGIHDDGKPHTRRMIENARAFHAAKMAREAAQGTATT